MSTKINTKKNVCDTPHLHTKEFLGSHWVFYNYLLKGGLVERIDPLNNVQEILSSKVIVDRDGCLCKISNYGYRDLKCLDNKVETITILIWPDGFWLLESEYTEGSYEFISDDFKKVILNADKFDSVETIETFVQTYY